MGTQYYDVKMYGVYLGEDSIPQFLAKHGYHVKQEDLDEGGWEVISEISGLEYFEVITDNPGGYTSYFGIRCNNEEQGKLHFNKAFPKVVDAHFYEFAEAL